MPAYNPDLYPSHPIQIPEELPKILKNYTKASIRTQPTDLLLWSAYYFRYVICKYHILVMTAMYVESAFGCVLVLYFKLKFLKQSKKPFLSCR